MVRDDSLNFWMSLETFYLHQLAHLPFLAAVSKFVIKRLPTGNWQLMTCELWTYHREWPPNVENITLN